MSFSALSGFLPKRSVLPQSSHSKGGSKELDHLLIVCSDRQQKRSQSHVTRRRPVGPLPAMQTGPKKEVPLAWTNEAVASPSSSFCENGATVAAPEPAPRCASPRGGDRSDDEPTPRVISRRRSRRRSSLGLRTVEPLLTLEAGQECISFEHIDKWGFDVFTLAGCTNDKPLQFMGHEVLSQAGLIDSLELDREKLGRFLQRAEDEYENRKKVPYHNSLHAADVTQTVFSLLTRCGFHAFLSQLKFTSLLLSAIVHDIGHDGHSNSFHVAAMDHLALRYNDRSVLENMHASKAFELLLVDDTCNLLRQFSRETLAQIREDMIGAVLMTDMQMHKQQMQVCTACVDRLGSRPPEWVADLSGAVSNLQNFILHAADISSSTKNEHLAERWASLLQEECFRQGDDERSLQLPVSPMCDRYSVCPATQQVGFMQFVLIPTFDVLARMSPNVEGEVMMNCQANLEQWTQKSLDEEPQCGKKANKPRSKVERGHDG